MFKKQLDFRLINIALFSFVIFILYCTNSLWLGIVMMVLKITFPFILAFSLAYAFYPFLQFLKKYGIVKIVGCIIIILFLFSFVIILVINIIPTIFNQFISLLINVLSFFKTLSFKYNINIDKIQDIVTSNFNLIVNSFGRYLSYDIINIVSIVSNYITNILISLICFIYFLNDMDRIRLKIKQQFKHNTKVYNYLCILDKNMKNYFLGLIMISVITFVEYSLALLVIRHPNYMLLGILATIFSVIPYFGGIMVGIIAIVSSLAISYRLFIRTIILFLVLSIIDSYIINPIVLKKINKMHPLLLIFLAYVFEKVLGVVGVVISLPASIMIITTYKYLKKVY